MKELVLGKNIEMPVSYSPDILFPIPRNLNRQEEFNSTLYLGADIWTFYELSWLNRKGKPVVAIAELVVPSYSPNIIESKSLKLYLNSLQNLSFSSSLEIKETILSDLNPRLGYKNEYSASLNIYLPEDFSKFTFLKPKGQALDRLDIECCEFEPNKNLLMTDHSDIIESNLYTELFKSNCPVTGQPDWATIIIDYCGTQINEAALLRYLISWRNHTGFHESCVEQIFLDIMEICKPLRLSIFAKFTRRGGIDINPFRSNFSQVLPLRQRTYRQ